MKALGGDLLRRTDRISIKYLPDGKPIATIDREEHSSINISISHDAGIVVAVAIAYEQ